MKDVVSDVNDDARIQEAFSLFDKDNSGEIELDELGNFKIQDERVSWKLISSFRYDNETTRRGVKLCSNNGKNVFFEIF